MDGWFHVCVFVGGLTGGQPAHAASVYVPFLAQMLYISSRSSSGSLFASSQDSCRGICSFYSFLISFLRMFTFSFSCVRSLRKRLWRVLNYHQNSVSPIQPPSTAPSHLCVTGNTIPTGPKVPRLLLTGAHSSHASITQRQSKARKHLGSKKIQSTYENTDIRTGCVVFI